MQAHTRFFQKKVLFVPFFDFFYNYSCTFNFFLQLFLHFPLFFTIILAHSLFHKSLSGSTFFTTTRLFSTTKVTVYPL